MPASTGSVAQQYAESSRTRPVGSVTKVGAAVLAAAKQVFEVESVMVTGASWTPVRACEITVMLPVPGGTLNAIALPTPRLQNVWADWESADVFEGRTQTAVVGSGVVVVVKVTEVNVGVCGNEQAGPVGKAPAVGWSMQSLVIDMVPVKAGPPSGTTQAPPSAAGELLFPQPSRVNQAQAQTTAIVLCMSGGSLSGEDSSGGAGARAALHPHAGDRTFAAEGSAVLPPRGRWPIASSSSTTNRA
jgi:hypothetical protein